MKKYKMLFAGESWLTHNMEVKGWDDFSVGGYAKGQKEKGLKVFETKVDKAVFVALLALLVICIYFVGTGRINPLG